jgi:hypothetical protein
MRTKKSRAKTAKLKTKKVDNSFRDRLPKNRGEYLEVLIRFTERAITNGMPEYLVAQADRLKAELAEWKASNS